MFVEVGEPWRTKAGIFAVCSSCLDANLRWFVDLKFMCLWVERSIRAVNVTSSCLVECLELAY